MKKYRVKKTKLGYKVQAKEWFWWVTVRRYFGWGCDEPLTFINKKQAEQWILKNA